MVPRSVRGRDLPSASRSDVARVYIDSGSMDSLSPRLVYEKDLRKRWTWSTCACFCLLWSFLILVDASLFDVGTLRSGRPSEHDDVDG